MGKIKKLSMITVMAVGLLTMGLMAAPASAYFTDQATATITGKTGSVNIHFTYKVNLPQDMQPGHVYWVKAKIHEQGVCPVKLWTNVTNVPWFLKVYVYPPTVAILKYCNTAVFNIKVVMPSWVGNTAMNKPVALYFTVYAQNL